MIPAKNLAGMTVLFTLFIFTSHVLADAPYPDSYFDELYKRIDLALSKGEKKKADFWTARYLGVSSSGSNLKKSPNDLNGLLKKRKLTPSSFLSDEYDPEFIKWFVDSSYRNWAVSEEHVRERSNAFEIRSETHGDHFLTVSATPEIQTWYISGEDSTPLIIAVGAPAAKPTIYCGKLVGRNPTIYFQSVSLDIGKRGLLFMWPPEFYDLDADKIPEIWLRYNVTALNGFSQVLAIYKIVDDNQLVLLKKFKADSEGVARRAEGNSVELGWGVGSKPNIPHMSYDKYHLELLEFKNGEFTKISEKTTRHILKNSDWKKYYL